MAQELYKDEHHQCLMDLTQDTGAIIDPGGNMAYNELYLGVTHYFPPQRLGARS
jgi:flavorubredoxin